ncbi:hypothetical protein B0H11DRAFT_2286220 [Mycena galericulata]|nr:hypothetical protein B0H11DRAFT_2286220 [Mycena galericulata]
MSNDSDTPATPGPSSSSFLVLPPLLLGFPSSSRPDSRKMLSIASTLVALAVLARPAAAAISNNGLQIFAPGGDNLWWALVVRFAPAWVAFAGAYACVCFGGPGFIVVVGREPGIGRMAGIDFWAELGCTCACAGVIGCFDGQKIWTMSTDLPCHSTLAEWRDEERRDLCLRPFAYLFATPSRCRMRTILPLWRWIRVTGGGDTASMLGRFVRLAPCRLPCGLGADADEFGFEADSKCSWLRSSRIGMLAYLLSVSTSASFYLSSAPRTLLLWWRTIVVGQVNNVVWSCAEASPAAQQFTIWINNNDTTLLTAITPLIAVEQNFNCDQGIPANLMNQPVGDGYVIVLTDITNATNIYAQSDPFSIKALSAGYPPASATPVDQASATVSKGSASNSIAGATGSAGGAAPTKSSSASRVGAGAGVLAAVGAFAAALVL